MAAGFAAAAAPSGTTHKYNGRITMLVVLSCAMASMGGFILGYDIGISGGVTSMAPFLNKFFPDVYSRMRDDTTISNYCKFNSHLLTLFTSSLYLAGLVSSFAASFVNQAYGRRPTILAGGAAFLAGSALNGAAVSIYMLIFGRVLLGVGVGFANQAVPLYLSEMAPVKYRGAFNNGFQFSLGIGALTANLINYTVDKTIPSWGWRLSLALAGVPASALALGALFLPETPNSIIQRTHDREKAERMLRRIRGTEDVRSELDDLVGASENSNDSPYRKILQKSYRPQLVMSFAIPFFQQVTGINVIAFYAPVVCRTIGFGESASLLSSVMTGAVGSTSTFVSMLVVDRFGRRFLLISGGVVMLATNVVVGVVMGVKLGDRGGLSDGYAYLVLVVIGIYVAGFSVSWGPLGWLIPSEIFPMEIRSVGQSVTVAVNFLFTFVVGQMSLSMLCRMKAGIFFFYGGWVAVMTVFVWLFLPETKNVPIERMGKVWREHWFWNKIVGSM